MSALSTSSHDMRASDLRPGQRWRTPVQDPMRRLDRHVWTVSRVEVGHVWLFNGEGADCRVSFGALLSLWELVE